MTQLPPNQIDANAHTILSKLEKIVEAQQSTLSQSQYILLHNVLESLRVYVSYGRTTALANDFLTKLALIMPYDCYSKDVVNAIKQARFECK